jgi:hypothetical protein
MGGWLWIKDWKVGGTIFKPLFQHFIEQVEENHENMYNLEPSQYKTGVNHYSMVFCCSVFVTYGIKSMFTFLGSSIYGSW